jgi:chromosome partitioning protein
MDPLGYVAMQPSMRLDRPVIAYQRWLSRIPQVYAEEIAEPETDNAGEIATIRNFRSLMPLAHDARKPMFDLRAADGAIGSTSRYVQVCHREFRDLSNQVLTRLGLRAPDAIDGKVGA